MKTDNTTTVQTLNDLRTGGIWELVYETSHRLPNEKYADSIVVKTDNDSELISNSDGRIIADLRGSHGFRYPAFKEAEANAKYICLAVNNLQPLLDALKDLIPALDAMKQSDYFIEGSIVDNYLKAAKEAIKKAETL